MLGAVLFFALALWAARHAVTVADLAAGQAHKFALVFLVAFVILSFQTVLAVAERAWTVTAEQADELAQLVVAVNIPIYNEDPPAVQETIASLLDQTRLPQVIHAVNDGSNPDLADYTQVKAWAEAACADRGVTFLWVDKPNGGKRSAQVATFAGVPEADVFLTVDSDALLDSRAVEEGLKPFADPTVMCVAGVVLALNDRANLLARLTDLWFVVGQLTDRSSLSAMNSVLVNSGPLAMYRADVIREHLHAYTNETFMGRRVEFSDDSMLTLYCLLRGKAVQQPTAFAFTLMPEKVSHHLRQYLRWMRGAFIRSIWRFRYLPVNRYAYWAHLLGWTQMILGLWVFVALFIVGGVIQPSSLPWLLFVPVAVGYGQALRYLSVHRSDQSRWSQVATVALSPIATLWAFFVLRAVRLYGIATCRKTGWGTRQSVEVSMTS